SVGHNVEVGGIAFAGSRGIQKVEVSTDDGASWHEAKLQPALSQDSWVLWTWQWKPTLAGTYTLVVRATDGTGDLQTEHMQGTVPNGATGYHVVKVMAV
ncbi:MAG: molybdopterin-binding oxidoreductase, partial [Chloroflexi bacterium]|nr:molybdopterin-binding oxidoreductase [Chloroflexota bacterium]